MYFGWQYSSQFHLWWTTPTNSIKHSSNLRSQTVFKVFWTPICRRIIEASEVKLERVRVKVRTTTFLELPKPAHSTGSSKFHRNDGHKINDEIEASEFIQITGQDGKLCSIPIEWLYSSSRPKYGQRPLHSLSSPSRQHRQPLQWCHD